MSRVMASVAALLLFGCAEVRLPLVTRSSTSGNLQFQVRAEPMPGAYTLNGTTDLPDQKFIRVAAVRYLYPSSEASRKLDSKPTYSVLAYQTVPVTNGKWQTTLKLWQVAPDGRFQEAWQISQSQMGLSLRSQPEVVFVATLPPSSRADALQAIEQELQKQGKTLEAGLVRTTTDGQRFVQAAETIAVALPTGGTTRPSPKVEDINGGWGNRFLMPEEPQNPYKLEPPSDRRTTAKPAQDEFMR
ncbi:hypothetical protein H6F43_06370 [Leptolyngbya sp. FACHB-36]|uniref:hypothetical protein n=1 Tax=Leptolyngbya sp. FACHB-36 TaxID=2692808 RepID=UPI001680E009|nr:hypothetical protein [Leptolyngbya sp. FACHB-36]MBD2019812.1 hypothetical protein [Leptolyngbya sp. FACHB-36]